MGFKAGKTKGTFPGGAAALGTVFQFPVNHQLSLSNPRISSQPLIKMEPYLSRTAALSVHQGQSQGKAGKEGINSHHQIVLLGLGGWKVLMEAPPFFWEAAEV